MIRRTLGDVRDIIDEDEIPNSENPKMAFCPYCQSFVDVEKCRARYDRDSEWDRPKSGFFDIECRSCGKWFKDKRGFYYESKGVNLASKLEEDLDKKTTYDGDTR